MKPYFIGNAYDGCYYVRCLLPQNANGWNGEKETLQSRRKPLEQVAREVLDHDVVVFQRPDEPVRVEVAQKLKQLGKKIVFDNDDTFKNVEVDNLKLLQRLETKIESIDEFLLIADLVTTTTEFLAEEYRVLNDNVLVLPNCIDEDDWEEPKRNEGDKVRIGIVGSTTSTKDFYQIEKLLYKLNYMPNVQIVMFGLPEKNKELRKTVKLYHKEFDFWGQFDIEWQPFVMIKDYQKTLNNLRLDIMLIPRENNYFNRCKSNVKFLEASMCKVPVIAQGFLDGKSPYQGKEDSKYMEIALSDKDWEEKTLKLIRNKELRRKMGEDAYKYVINNYNIKDKAKLWADAYKKLWTT